MAPTCALGIEQSVGAQAFLLVPVRQFMMNCIPFIQQIILIFNSTQLDKTGITVFNSPQDKMWIKQVRARASFQGNKIKIKLFPISM